MSTVTHPSPGVAPETPRWTAYVLVPEMWASLAITAMWTVVAISAVWGPDFVSTSGSGTSSTTIPSGIAVAVFATIGTWVVAKYAFGRRGGET
jgi:hypothetical protein